jgi:hypothetical protein
MVTQTGQENGNSPFSNERYLLFLYHPIRAMRERLAASHFGRVCAGSLTRIGWGVEDAGIVPTRPNATEMRKSRRRPSTVS